MFSQGGTNQQAEEVIEFEQLDEYEEDTQMITESNKQNRKLRLNINSHKLLIGENSHFNEASNRRSLEESEVP